MPRAIAQDCWFLTGPTAAGKTGVGIELAATIGAEIVSMDSMAIYRGMDIGTAKPSADERRKVPHHLIDAVDPHESFSLAQYLAAAEACVGEIRSRGREALFVGGTPLYLKGLLRGVFEGPAADWELRRRLEEEARCGEAGLLHRRLGEVDPASARRLHPRDTRRIIRALEVHAKTGQPISDLQRQFEVACPAEACRVFVLDWPREALHARIDRRVDEMFALGLVDEVRGLLGGASPLSKTAGQALGYREVLEHLAGRATLDDTVAAVKLHTRQFAKRQGTWFRSLEECRFVAELADAVPAEIAGRIAVLGSTRASSSPVPWPRPRDRLP